MDRLIEVRVMHYESGDMFTLQYYIPIGSDGRMNMSRVTAELSTDYQILSIRLVREN